MLASAPIYLARRQVCLLRDAIALCGPLGEAYNNCMANARRNWSFSLGAPHSRKTKNAANTERSIGRGSLPAGVSWVVFVYFRRHAPV